MGQALYRKHRSTSLSEIVGQEHITTALEQALKTGRISHAYLFTGPRGTGKTSIARILAHAINDLPYTTDGHLDIIEIDAASNRRIDEIRDLRDKVYIAPTSAKFKVYIIDEVHMLTREAFNALLKTLEEPPAHVVFILATTDAHKLPETIISRTQRYTFRPVEQNKVTAHLAHIAKSEGISVDKDALELLARHGEGSFRDSISMLDQVGNHGDNVTLEAVRIQLGIPPDEAVTELISTLSGDTIHGPVIALQKLYDNGFRAPAIADQLADRIRNQLTENTSALQPAVALALLKKLLDVASAHSPERYLEILVMEAVTPQPPTAQQPVVDTVRVTAPHKPTPRTALPKVKPAPMPVHTSTEDAELEPLQVEPTVPIHGQSALDDSGWTAVLAELKKQYNTVYGIVRMAKTDLSVPGQVTLSFTFAFHQKRIKDAKNAKIVTDTIEAVTGQRVSLICNLVTGPTTPVKAAAVPSAVPSGDKLHDIASVFGGGELL